MFIFVSKRVAVFSETRSFEIIPGFLYAFKYWWRAYLEFLQNNILFFKRSPAAVHACDGKEQETYGRIATRGSYIYSAGNYFWFSILFRNIVNRIKTNGYPSYTFTYESATILESVYKHTKHKFWPQLTGHRGSIKVTREHILSSWQRFISFTS